MRKWHDNKYLGFCKSCVDSTLRYNARKGKREIRLQSSMVVVLINAAHQT